MGDQGLPLGRLVHFHDGSRAFSQFTYHQAWLERPKTFAVSPELGLMSGPHICKPAGAGDAAVFFALADTSPGPWARKVIQHAHRKACEANPALPPLEEVQYLSAVNDAYRTGALRFVDGSRPSWIAQSDSPPSLDDLPRAIGASWALERGSGFAADLNFLMAHGTSLGGSRPKISVRDADGTLALAKLPRLDEPYSVPRAEVLALALAKQAGIRVAEARIISANDTPVALIRRFDRTEKRGRKHYISAASLLEASEGDALGYLDLLHAMRRYCARFADDARQLWRRLVFNLLITNVDDHLRNIGFLYEGKQRWRLAPALDLNPFPGKAYCSHTPLSVRAGKIVSVQMLLDHAELFELNRAQSRKALGEVAEVICGWRAVAQQMGIRKSERELLKPAFEHDRLKEVVSHGG